MGVSFESREAETLIERTPITWDCEQELRQSQVVFNIPNPKGPPHMRIFPLGIDNEAAGTAPVSVLTAPNNLRIRALQFAVANVGEADGGCFIQVGTNPTFLGPGSYAATQSPASLLANVVLDTRFTTSGMGSCLGNVVIPCDFTLNTGQSLNLFVGTISGTVAVYGLVLVICD